MRPEQKDEFVMMLAEILSFYDKDISPFSIQLWWGALKRFELAEVQRAMALHYQNPDQGKYAPRPGDIIRLLEGSSQDGAARAWSKVDSAVRKIGPYQDVVFDDPIIHAVIVDMGGWVGLGQVTEEEWPFRANEFQRRYQGYATRGGVSNYPAKLTGIANAHNEAEGRTLEPPVLVGNQPRARLVYQRGGEKAGPEFKRATDLGRQVLAMIGSEQESPASMATE